MASLDRIRVEWTGLQGGTGISTFYGQPITQGVWDAIGTFFTALKLLLPSTANINVQSSGDTIDEVTGKLVGSWLLVGAPTIIGSSTANYASAVGAAVQWNTGLVVGGKRIKGRTFIVPLTSTAFEANGTLSSLALNTLRTAAAALSASSNGALRIWRAPHTMSLKDPRPSYPGVSGPLTAPTVKDTGAILRGRRD